MAVIPVVFDSFVPFAAKQSASATLLMLPLGCCRLLDALADQIAGEETSLRQLLVIAPPGAAASYRDDLHRFAHHAAEVTTQENLHQVFLTNYEDADSVMIIDPRHWPLDGYSGEEISRHLREYRGVTHAVCLNPSATRETIQRDNHGHVRRIQRFYNLMHWPEVAQNTISYTLVSVPALRDIHFRSLGELRRALAAKGVLSRDFPLTGGSIDLTSEWVYLSLHEGRLADLTAEQRRYGFTMTTPEVLVAPDARIDPTARLVPPIIVQEQAVIEPNVTIVGPAVVGAGSVIQEGAAVIQAAVVRGTTIAPGAVVRHCIAAGECHGSLAGREKPTETVAGDLQDPTASTDPLAALPITESTPQAVHRRRVHEAIKRFVDIVVSATTLLLLSPLMVLTALLVKLDSRGPIFFIHRRESKGGKDFPCLKFRTMSAGAHLQQRQLYQQSMVDGPQFKINNDPRVTRLGRWLRATNIDELPQLLNVLWGHMSLVGPRPSPFRENQICVPWRLARLSIRPGITGLWQVCRQDDRSRGDFHEWIYYDITYVRQFSIWLDIKIFLATLITLGGRWSVPLSWLANTNNAPEPTGQALRT